MSRLKDPLRLLHTPPARGTHDRGPHASATAWGSRYRCNGMRQPGCRAPNQLARLALPSSPCPAWPRSEEGAPHCEQEEALRSRSPSPSSTAERRPKRRRNQARVRCVAQASCAESFRSPAAKTGAAQSEGCTMRQQTDCAARRSRATGAARGPVWCHGTKGHLRAFMWERTPLGPTSSPSPGAAVRTNRTLLLRNELAPGFDAAVACPRLRAPCPISRGELVA